MEGLVDMQWSQSSNVIRFQVTLVIAPRWLTTPSPFHTPTGARGYGFEWGRHPASEHRTRLPSQSVISNDSLCFVER